MYNEQLEEMSVSVDALHLDPNNPRFWSEQTRNSPDVPDRKIADEPQQIKAKNKIAEHGLEELKNSILRNGFLPLDRIVVRELEGNLGNYVAIEGNRRLAALKMLRDEIADNTISEPGISEEYLEILRANTDQIEVLVYKGDDTKDIAWILQGIRHIGGIRDWSPAQQGKLVADQIDKEGLGFTEAGQRFGLSAQAVGKRYRSYKALEQMRGDEEYQSRAENKFYSLFEEAVKQKEVKKWLGWDDEQSRFTNTDNLKQFYSWICTDEENEDPEKRKRRLHDPRHIGHLGRIISLKQDALLDQIDKHEVEVEAAFQKLKDQNYRYDWRNAFKKMYELIDDIPNAALQEAPEQMLESVQTAESKLARIRNMIAALPTTDKI